jgi:hypothetical protein
MKPALHEPVRGTLQIRLLIFQKLLACNPSLPLANYGKLQIAEE